MQVNTGWYATIGWWMSGLFALLMATVTLGQTAHKPLTDGEKFETYKQGLMDRAIADGVSPTLVKRLLLPIQGAQKVLSKQKYQPEFVSTFWHYYLPRSEADKVKEARQKLAEQRVLLTQARDTYGVPQRFLVALWGLESRYGEVLGNHDVLEATLTLAYTAKNAKRQAFFEQQVLAVLRLLQQGRLHEDDLQGSWAGAMGQCQFMPSNIEAYGVDGNGNGHIDLRRELADVFMSSAHFLKELGWQTGQTWGREVSFKDRMPHVWIGQTQPLKKWQLRGFRQADGSPLSSDDIPARLLRPAGAHGPVFLVYPNFDVIRRWNKSDAFALTVGLMADLMIYRDGLQHRPQNIQPLKTEHLRQVQQKLKALGFDVGTVDGVWGKQTRLAYQAYQQSIGEDPDGYVDVSAVQRLLSR